MIKKDFEFFLKNGFDKALIGKARKDLNLYFIGNAIALIYAQHQQSLIFGNANCKSIRFLFNISDICTINKIEYHD